MFRQASRHSLTYWSVYRLMSGFAGQLFKLSGQDAILSYVTFLPGQTTTLYCVWQFVLARSWIRKNSDG
jgi:hypothetical protein